MNLSTNPYSSAEKCMRLALFSGACLACAVPVALFSSFRLALMVFASAHYVLHFLSLFFAAAFLRQLAAVSGRTGMFVVFLIAIFWLTAEISGFLPVTTRDSLIYQLHVPNEWLRADRILEIPWHDSSYYPLLLGISYAPLIAAKLDYFLAPYHATFLLLAAAVAAAINLRLGKNPLYALLTALTVVTTPLCFRLATEPMADLALMTYFGCSIYFALLWQLDPKSRAYPMLLGLGLGLSLSVKYSAVVASALFCLALLGFLLQSGVRLRQIVSSFLLLAMVVMLIYLPWAARNYLWTGDPIYPLLKGYVGEGDEYAFVGAIPPMLYRHEVYQESWLEILLIPLRMITGGVDGSARTFDGVLTPILFLLIIPFVLWKKGRGNGPILIFLMLPLGLHVVIVPLLHHLLTRYHAPFAASAFALSLYGLQILLSSFAFRSALMVAGIVLVSHFLVVVPYQLRYEHAREIRGFLSGALSREQYLLKHLDEYRIAKAVNETLPEKSRVYLLFTGNRYYYYKREVRGAYFSAKIILETLRKDPSAAALARKFKELGITHLVFQEPRLARALEQAFRDEERLKFPWASFVKQYLKQLLRVPPYSLWEISDEPSEGFE